MHVLLPQKKELIMLAFIGQIVDVFATAITSLVSAIGGSLKG